MSDATHSPRNIPEDGSGQVIDFPRARDPEHSPGHLPLELSSFVGREREIAEVKELLAEARLLTLCGPGGCGKTRLGLAVARDVAEGFDDGAWWVELASLSGPELVPQAVAQALGVRDVPGRSLTEMLIEHLQSRNALLVLDNCEHLVAACATLVDTLLRSCPDLRVLATSREPLGVAGEVAWSVPPLSSPDPRNPPPVEESLRYEAVRLFVERARSVVSHFELTEQNAAAVARVCIRLDGMLLAIELAAARTRILSVEQIAQRLKEPLELLTGGSRTAVPRHQTLRAILKWSYDLLSEPERVLFRRLSVFVGGWDLEAVEAVGAVGDVHAGEVLDLLGRLVDQSLVVAEAGAGDSLCYGMLEPVRQYARELLEESGEADEVRGRHATLFRALAERAHPELRGPDQVQCLERLDRENGNLRAAMAWALSESDAENAARLGWALWPFWWYRGRHREGRRLADAALENDLPAALRIRTTVSAAIMAYGQADNDAVVRYVGELMELSRQVGGDAYAEAYVKGGQGLVAMNRQDFEEATARLEEALPLFLECGEVWTAAQTHTWLGLVLLLQGNHEGAMRGFEEGLALARRIGDRTGAYNALYNLALMALVRGDHEPAASMFKEGMTLSEEMGDRANVAYCLEGLAAVAAAQGEARRAACLFGAAGELLETISVPVWTFYEPVRSLYERTIADLHTRLGESAFETAWNEGRQMAFERAMTYALEETAPPPKDTAGLSARELEVLRLVAEGLTDSQVAQRLYLSPRTVGQHLRSIYRKLGVPSRAAAAREAVERGLI